MGNSEREGWHLQVLGGHIEMEKTHEDHMEIKDPDGDFTWLPLRKAIGGRQYK